MLPLNERVVPIEPLFLSFLHCLTLYLFALILLERGGNDNGHDTNSQHPLSQLIIDRRLTQTIIAEHMRQWDVASFQGAKMILRTRRYM